MREEKNEDGRKENTKYVKEWRKLEMKRKEREGEEERREKV